MELLPRLLEDLLKLHEYQLAETKGFRNKGFLLYFYKKILQEFIEDGERWMERERKIEGSEAKFPVLEAAISDAKNLIRRIDKVLEEFPTLKKIVEKLEKKNFFKRIIEATEG